MIHFNVPPYVGNEFKYMEDAVKKHKICGDGISTLISSICRISEIETFF